MEKFLSSNQTFPKAAVIVIALYAGAQMLSDVASLKIGVVFGLAVDMGTFIYPITFTLRDLVHKTIGKRNTKVLIFTTAFLNLFMALYLFWSSSVASDSEWALGEAFSAIMSPMWRIVIASIIAETVSEIADTEVYHRVASKIKGRQWARVLISNSVSVPLDNLIFAFGAFAFAMPLGVVLEIFIINLAVKYVVTLLSMPLIYTIPSANRKNED